MNRFNYLNLRFNDNEIDINNGFVRCTMKMKLIAFVAQIHGS